MYRDNYSGNKSDRAGRSVEGQHSLHNMQLSYELALKERDEAVRKNALVLEERNQVLNQYQNIKQERDQALAALGNANPAKMTNRDIAVHQLNANNSLYQHSLSPSKKAKDKPYSTSAVDYNIEGSERILWESHSVSINKESRFGFGIAVSGGRDNPHFASGEPSIAISDVLKGGPAEGKLQVNDRVLSVNGISLENVDHATAISVLKDAGNYVNLVIRRKVVMPIQEDFEQPFKVTLNKRGKKDEFGLILGCKYYVKEIVANSLAAQDGSFKEGDTILKINNTPVESLSLTEARRQFEKSRDKLQLVISKSSKARNQSFKEGWDDSRLSQTNAEITDRYPPLTPSSPLKPLSFEDLDRPATPILDQLSSPYDEPPPRPPPPNTGMGHASPLNGYHDEPDTRVARRANEGPEPRTIKFHKGDAGLGIRVFGGNKSGIYVAGVAPGTPASHQGLLEGDVILSVNDQSLRGLNREEAVILLQGLQEHIIMIVQHKKPEYERLMKSGFSGDDFHIRAHFNYDHSEHGEMKFQNGDVFHVLDTLYNGVIGSWSAMKIDKNNKETKAGIIPNKERAEHMAANQYSGEKDSSSKAAHRGGSFFKKKTARRAKSLGKDHWDDVIFSNPGTKFPAYEKVVLQNVSFKRPVVIFGALADIVRERLVRDVPEKFESPQSEGRRGVEDSQSSKSGIIRLDAIKRVMSKNKHCVLDVTPNAVDKLNYTQHCPIVIYLYVDSKQSVKDLRARYAKGSSKSVRKQYDVAVKTEKLYSHLFTHRIDMTGGDSWYVYLKETIEKAQRSPIWMSESKPSNNQKEEFLFPMNMRLSYASSPESELDLRSSIYDETDYTPDLPQTRRRMIRSNSDPSINTGENIPGIPPYNAPPEYHRSRPLSVESRLPRDRGLYTDTEDYARVPSGRAYTYRRDDIPYPTFTESMPQESHRPHYATLTPSERLQGIRDDRGYRSDHGAYFDGQMRRPARSSGYATDQDWERSYHNQLYSDAYGSSDYLNNDIRGDGYRNQRPHQTRGYDPYAFTRSTAHPSSAANIDRNKLSDLRNKYRSPEDYHLASASKSTPLNRREVPLNMRAKSESILYPRDAVPDEQRPSYEDRLRYDDHIGDPAPPPQSRTQHAPSIDQQRASNYYNNAKSTPNLNRYADDRARNRSEYERPMSNIYESSYVAQNANYNEQSADENLPKLPPKTRHQANFVENPVSRLNGPTSIDSGYSAPNKEHTSSSYALPAQQEESANYAQKGYREQTDMRSNDMRSNDMRSNDMRSNDSVDQRSVASRDFVSSRDSGYPGSLERHQENPQIIDPINREKRNSAFNLYKKPESSSPPTTASNDSGVVNGMMSDIVPGTTILKSNDGTPMIKDFLSDDDSSDQHTVVATARGVFDVNGGMLESKETGVSIIIPKGAIDEGIQQEIYFKVCKDNTIMPPLDQEKGEKLLSPLVMCGPHGLKFKQPVELRLPHCASVNPNGWSFALKSSNSPTGHPAQWQNMTLANLEGVSQGKVEKNKVSVLVDHF